MKILFALSSPEYLRFYDETIRQLARRGHDVAVSVSAFRDGKPVRLSVLDREPRVTIVGLVPDRDDVWISLARAVRGTMDFIRYFHPRLAHASALRARMFQKALPWPLQVIDRIEVVSPARLAVWMRRLARLEQCIPISRRVRDWLDAQRPDLLLVSPLVEKASDQVDLVRAAQASGVRVGVLIASWDNLTNKGDLRVPTDRIFVWNEAQKREAVELHRVDPATVVVTGAQPFDRWFGREPSRSREEFCREVGLPADRPFVMYTGSSIFIARAEHEMPFVRRWIDAIRDSGDPVLRDLAILVRPHPYNGQAWDPHVYDDMENVSVWPPGGYDPVDERNRNGFFDSMYHSAAVVGINTSAMIESAIVGRPVLSITPPEFAGTQGGTLHFQHLLPENGGFLRVATSLDDHVQQLRTLLQDPVAARAELDRFVGSFIRPHGRDRAGNDELVAGIEQFGGTPRPLPAAVSAWDGVRTALAFPLALLAILFPPEGWRQPVRRTTRHLGLEARWTVRDSVRGIRRLGGETVRGTRRLKADTRRAAVTTMKRVRRAGRQARYHLGLFARRLRGAPLD